MLLIVNLGDGHMEFIISLFTLYKLKISIIEKWKTKKDIQTTTCYKLFNLSEIYLLCQTAIKVSNHLLSISLYNLSQSSYKLCLAAVPGHTP